MKIHYLAIGVLVVVLLKLAAWPQIAQQGPQSVYEGQNVAAVDLIGNPHRDLTPLKPLIRQKASEPYSQSKIEASIAALQATNEFKKVEVSIVPAPSGLRLDFLLEPAYYLGVLSFPEAIKKYSYSRLLQVVDLPEEDPYDPARVAAGEEALRGFLRHNGYFQATVKSAPEIDDGSHLVNLNFAVVFGKRAKIGNVSLEGPEGAEQERLNRAIRSIRARATGGLLKPGKPYTPERITAATALIQRSLSQQHHLDSHVKELPPRFNAETNRVDVGFKVDLGPIVNVSLTGAKLSVIPLLSGREMKKLIPIYSEGTIDPDLVQEGQQNLVDFFQKKGYFDVKVDTKFDHREGQVFVVYNVDKGRKHKVDRIVFRGGSNIPEKDLLSVVTVKKARLLSRGNWSQKLVKQSASNLEALYRDRGFEEVKVEGQSIDHEPKIDVLFNIEEGPRTFVRNITITGNANIPYQQLGAPVGFRLAAGAPFSPRLLAEDRNRVSANYLDHGYLNAEVKTTVDRDAADPHQLNITFSVEEHQLVRISKAIYLGQKHTQEEFLKKAARISPESPMRKRELLASESRLYDLNIFDWASVGPTKPITDQTDEAVVAKVHEAKRTEITYGFGFEVSHRGGNIPTGTVAVPGGTNIQLNGYQIAPSQSTFASPRGSIGIDRHNMRGLGEIASASILISRLDQRLLTTYAQPHFFGSSWRSLTSFSEERTTENPLFGATLTDASFQLERLLNRKNNTRFQIRYDFNNTILSQILVPDLVLSQDRNVHLSTLSGTLLRDTRDKPLDAHHGSFTSLSIGITPTALGSSANFAKFLGQYAYYKPLHSVVFANSIRLGLAKSFDGSFVPTSQLFFSGGGTSLRGFPIDQAGPQRLVPFCNVLTGQTGCVNVTVPVGGRQLFVLNSEVRFPLGIMKALGGVVFYDGGNVYSAISLHNSYDNFTNTIGVGLRYATPIGPVRIDIGRNLNPVPGITPTQYFITLGQAF